MALASGVLSMPSPIGRDAASDAPGVALARFGPAASGAERAPIGGGDAARDTDERAEPPTDPITGPTDDRAPTADRSDPDTPPAGDRGDAARPTDAALRGTRPDAAPESERADAAGPSADTPSAGERADPARATGAAPEPEQADAPGPAPEAAGPAGAETAGAEAGVGADAEAEATETDASESEAAEPDAGADAEGEPASDVEPAADPETAAEPEPAAEPAPAPEPAADAAAEHAGGQGASGGQTASSSSGGGGGGGGEAPMPASDTPTEDPATDGADGDEDDEADDEDLAAEMDAIGADVPEPSLGGGGGGGAAISPQPEAPAPDVSGGTPEAGAAQLVGVRPDKLAPALAGLGAAVGTDVADKRAALAEAPPTRGTAGGGVAPKPAPAGPDARPPAAAAETGPDVPTPPPTPTPEPTGDTPADRAQTPTVQGSESGQLSEADTRAMAASIDNLPTADPSTPADPGPPPTMPAAGSADPAQARRSRAAMDQRVNTAAVAARRETRRPLGEGAITVTEPPQTVTAAVPAGQAVQPKAPPSLPGPEQAEAIGIIAGKREGAKIDAALTKAQGEMAAERQKHAQTDKARRAEADKAIATLEQDAAAEQAREKSAAQTEVTALRGKWKAEVDQQTADARKQADAKVSEGLKTVERHQKKGEQDARKAHDEGQKQATRARQAGQDEAARLKKKSKKESGGFFGWLASKAKSFFNTIKKGISAAIDKARKLVKSAIDKAKKLAAAAIEAARKAIVGAIQLVGKALVAIGDRLLAGFPALRDRFRKAVQDRVEKATAAVNAAAKKLNQKVQSALDTLGKGLDAALGLLEKGLHFIVDGVNAMVQGAIKSAEGFINGVLAFAVLIKHVAAGPGAWVTNLGAAVVDGIKNHLWAAFKDAAKAWFESKLMEVLGIGGLVIKTLIAGGFDMARISKTAWEGLKAAIPIALITILVEKLVAMIVPAAGAVIAIIEGLQAAWGTVSRIIAAFAAFMAFLKLVKGGNAGPAFAKALAAAAIVLLDFVSNWLLKKIRKAARAIGKKLKGIAKKLGKKLRGKGKGKGKSKAGHKGGKGKKKDKSRDMAAARREAKKAARKGWKRAKAKTGKRVAKQAEVEKTLRQVEGTRGGARIKVDAQIQGDSWTVRATATRKGKTARASDGRGWVAKDEKGGRWLAAQNLTTSNKQLIASIFTGLTADDEKARDLKAEYQGKKKAAERLRKKGQARLDKRVRGLRLTVEIEPFSGVEKDKKMRTTVRIAPNTQEQTKEVPLDADSFAKRFKIAQPTGQVPVTSTGKARTMTRRNKIPMASKQEQIPGFVVNITTMPNAVKGGLARRYGVDAWAGGDRELGPARTAVAAGVNVFKSIDAQKTKKSRQAIQQATGRVMPVKRMSMAIFGFLWEPTWTDDGQPTTLAKVRAEYQKLKGDERKKALAAVEQPKGWKAGSKLPYGVFRDTVLTSGHTRRLVDGLSSSGFDPVHIVSQDDDGSLQTRGGRGLLAEYDQVLSQMKVHPLFTIGGYTFEGFDWGPEAGSRKQQLTELANAIDAAVRAAVGKIHPELLYPTEPNMLVKATDKKHGGGVFDDARLNQGKGLYGVGASEGRTAKVNSQAALGQTPTTHHAPSTRVTTSPEPKDPARGLSVGSDEVKALTAQGEHPYSAIERQSQNFANPRNLANERSQMDTSPDKNWTTKKSKGYFGQVHETGKALSDAPGSRKATRKAMLAQLDATHKSQMKNVDKAARKDPAAAARRKKALRQLRKITRQIILAMTARELKSTWAEIHRLLGEIGAEESN